MSKKIKEVDVQRVKAEFQSFIALNGSKAEITLTKENVMFYITVTDINRIPANITDGLQQDRNTIRIPGDQWHILAGPDRRPEKGDRVMLGGVRYAVETARPAQFKNTLIGYIVTLQG